MFKVINMDNLPIGENYFAGFHTEEEANHHLDELATQYIQKGYMAQNIPAQHNSLFNDPQMLKITKVRNVLNPNDPTNIIVFALVPQSAGEYIVITRNKMKHFSEAEDETNYNFDTQKESLNGIYEDLLAKGYRLIASNDSLLCFKFETDDFVSEVYVLNH